MAGIVGLTGENPLIDLFSRRSREGLLEGQTLVQRNPKRIDICAAIKADGSFGPQASKFSLSVNQATPVKEGEAD